MRKLLLIFICFITVILSIHWLRDWKADDVIEDADDEIFYLNSNTGWYVSVSLKDTIFKTGNSGITWTGYTTVDTNRLTALCFTDQNTGWAVGRRGKIVKSTTGGVSWFLQNSGVLTGLTSVSFFNSNTGIAVGSSDAGRVILQTTNSGSTWTQIFTQGTGKLYAVKMISNLIAYAAGDSGKILYTSNSGVNWAEQTTNVITPLRDITFKSASYGYAVGFNGVILSTSNGGTNWVNRSFNSINFYSVDFGSNDTGYIGGQFGRIYKTTNKGVNWILQPTPVDTSKKITEIFCINNQNAWAHAYGDILLYTTTGGLNGLSNLSNEIPSQYYLAQNYPNPFNPNTKIQFSVPKSSFTKLTIYDVTGRVMTILVNEELKPGKYEVDWDASHRASGVYYYKLETESYAETKKMVLLK